MDTESSLSARTSGFALAAAITCLLNTALACAKDASAPLKDFMKSIGGHDWTMQGLFDLALFVILGLVLANSRVAQTISAGRLITTFIGAIALAGVTLAVWYALT